MKEISVIVPVYNSEKFLKKCLNSILEQTIINIIDIIIVNDGSSDNSEEIILDFLKKYPESVKYYKQENGGLSSARNLGIKKSKTKYIGFVDSDDYIDKYMFEKMYNNIINTKSNIVICGIEKCDINGNKIVYEQVEKNEEMTAQETINKILSYKIQCYACNKIYERKLFIENNIEYPQGRFYEDIVTIFKLLKVSNKVSIIGEPLYYYVQHNESICRTPSLKKCNDVLLNLEEIINIGINNKIYISNMIVSSYILFCRAYFSYKNKNEIKNEVKKYKNKLKYFKRKVSLLEVIRSKENKISNKIRYILFYFGFMKCIYYILVKMGK